MNEDNIDNNQFSTVFFLGIGGIGMSALARYFLSIGSKVFGYDRVKTPLTSDMEKQGIVISYQDDIEALPENISLVVYTPAIPKDTLLFKEIIKRGYPLQKRAVTLGKIVNSKKVIAVSGTHGKTTTCGLIAHILSNSVLGCSAFLGGILKDIDTNFIYNPLSEYIVVEADEYDRSFLQLYPYATIITSIDPDHMDIYHTYEALHLAFEQFALQTKENGMLLVRSDRLKLIEDLSDKRKIDTYSLDNSNSIHMTNLRISKGTYYFDYLSKDLKLYDLHMTYPGLHNIENAIAAISVCIRIFRDNNISPHEIEKIIRQNLEAFSGMQRRLDKRLQTNKTIYIDDYAHHPKEIATTINALRQLYPDKKFTGVFQPHLYTRTRDLRDEFVKALELLDTIILLPIYPAREEPIKGVDSHILLTKIDKMDKYLVTKEQLMDLLEALEPEFLITFGAGDISQMVEPIVDLLKQMDC